MCIKNDNKIKINPPLIIIILTFLIIWIFCFLSNICSGTQMKTSQINKLDENWNVDGKTVDLPYKYEGTPNKAIIFENKLPDNILNGDIIAFNSNYAINNVYIDNQLVYSYGKDNGISFGKMTGNIKCIVDLIPEYSGKSIRIEIIPQYKNIYEMYTIINDNKDAVYSYIFFKDIWRLIVVVILAIVGLIAVFLSFTSSYNDIFNKKQLLYYSLFIFSVSIWILQSSDLPQFFTNANAATCFSSFMALIFTSVSYGGFCRYMLEKKYKILKIVQLLGRCIIILNLLLFVLNIKDPIELLLLTHIYMLFTIISVISCCIKEASASLKAKCILLSTIFFSIFVLLGLLSFYNHPGNGKDAIVIATGFVFFSFCLFCILLNNQIENIKKLLNMRIYKELAFKDGLTNLGNRAALDKKMSEFEDLQDGTEVSFLMFDLNYLKQTNDNLGHSEGDKLIINTAECIKKAFNDSGYCYRLGGDEFATIIIGRNNEIKAKINQLNNIIEEYNKTHENKISVALGCSSKVYNKEDKDFRKNIYKEADDKMYEMKKKQHEELAEI